MIKRRKRLIKNYYKKPNLFKIIITRAAVVFLILAAMILMITVRSYEIFLENERLFSDSPRTNFYENTLPCIKELKNISCKNNVHHRQSISILAVMIFKHDAVFNLLTKSILPVCFFCQIRRIPV